MTRAFGPECRILIVEDQVIIAMDAETLLTKEGIRLIDSAISNDEALRFIDDACPDAAILDLSLGATTSLPVARVLLERKVPFVFATGFDDRSLVPADMMHVPIVTKPYSGETLISALCTAMDRQNQGHSTGD